MYSDATARHACMRQHVGRREAGRRPEHEPDQSFVEFDERLVVQPVGGNIKSIDRGDGTKDTFIYDGFGRLTSGTAGAGKQQAYTYDAFGNILTITTDRDSSSQIKLGVDPSTNRISRPSSDPTTGEHYNAYGTYDANGKRTANVRGDSFVYDDLGMLKEATVGGARKVYLYTPDDERIAAVAIVNNTRQDATWTLRHPDGSVLRRYHEAASGSWTWNEDYVYAGGRLLAANVNAPEKTLHFFTDHLGSPRLITGSGGAEYVRRTYYPFGREAPAYHDYEAIGFTGHERDAATLTYMHARSHLPAWGRFLAPDPIWPDVGSAQAWNRYAYVENNPLNLIDPDGLLSMTITVVAEDPIHQWLREFDWWVMGRLEELSNASAGFGDTLTFGVTSKIRDKTGANVVVDKCSGWYEGGEWAAIATSTAIGGAAGLRASGTKLAGKEFSHWIPARLLRKSGSKAVQNTFGRSTFNGNYVTPARHFKHDPFRYPSGWRDFGPRFNPVARQLDRVPRVYYGAAAGTAYGGAGASVEGCDE